MNNKEDDKNIVFEEVYKLIKSINKLPTVYELNKIISESEIRRTYGGLSGFLKQVEEYNPDTYSKIMASIEKKKQKELDDIKNELVDTYVNKCVSSNSDIGVAASGLKNRIRTLFINTDEFYFKCRNRHPSFFQKIDDQNLFDEKVKEFIKFCKSFKVYPSLDELGISKKDMDRIAGSYQEFKNYIKKFYYSKVKGAIDRDIWNNKNLQKLIDLTKKYKKFLITTIVPNDDINVNFLSSIRIWEKEQNGLALFLISDNELSAVPEEIPTDRIIFNDISLNNNITVMPIKIPATNVRPSSGLQRITKIEKSIICSSPKQFLEMVPQSKQNKVPRALIFTGAITNPDYLNKMYYQKKSDVIAQNDHSLGAVIVEIENEKIFHFRHIQSLKDGSFIDLNKKYYPKTILNNVRAEAFIIGDLHAESINNEILENWEKVAKVINPKCVILHDIFDGYSINHHELEHTTTRARKYEQGKLSLKKELDNLVKILERMSKKFEKVYIVESNHDHFIKKYIDSGVYRTDIHNAAISHRLAEQLTYGNNPLEWYVKQHLKSKNIIWWDEKTHYEIEGCLVSIHGHRGPNGSRGSLTALEKIYQNVFVAHSHVPCIMRNGFQIGYSGGDHEYAIGPTSWLETSGIIYPGGGKQLINLINGKFTIDEIK